MYVACVVGNDQALKVTWVENALFVNEIPYKTRFAFTLKCLVGPGAFNAILGAVWVELASFCFFVEEIKLFAFITNGLFDIASEAVGEVGGNLDALIFGT